MKRIVALLVAASFPFVATADDKDAKSGQTKSACCQKAGSAEAKSACCAKNSQSVACKAACDAIAKDLPKLSYVVGDKKVCCPKEAESLAKGDAKAIKYVVAGKTFDAAPAAYDALTAELDSYFNKIVTVQYAVGEEKMSCPMSAEAAAKKAGKPMSYRLASFDFADKAKAEKAAADAKAAADKVSMKMMVGEKAYDCPMSAESAAKSCSGKVDYVVGEQKLCCPNMAKAALAQARIEAATEVIAKQAGV
jgi:hypothetical protein